MEERDLWGTESRDSLEVWWFKPHEINKEIVRTLDRHRACQKCIVCAPDEHHTRARHAPRMHRMSTAHAQQSRTPGYAPCHTYTCTMPYPTMPMCAPCHAHTRSKPHPLAHLAHTKHITTMELV